MVQLKLEEKEIYNKVLKLSRLAFFMFVMERLYELGFGTFESAQLQDV